jgi:hypothetical protein
MIYILLSISGASEKFEIKTGSPGQWDLVNSLNS